jgi:hypothetical protein
VPRAAHCSRSASITLLRPASAPPRSRVAREHLAVRVPNHIERIPGRLAHCARHAADYPAGAPCPPSGRKAKLWGRWAFERAVGEGRFTGGGRFNCGGPGRGSAAINPPLAFPPRLIPRYPASWPKWGGAAARRAAPNTPGPPRRAIKPSRAGRRAVLGRPWRVYVRVFGVPDPVAGPDWHGRRRSAQSLGAFSPARRVGAIWRPGDPRPKNNPGRVPNICTLAR